MMRLHYFFVLAVCHSIVGIGCSDSRNTPVNGDDGDARVDAAEAEDDPSATAPVVGVTFSVPSGTFEGTLSVALSTELSSAQIRYTTDNTPVDLQANLYDGSPLSLDATTQLRAQAYVNETPIGVSTTAIYVQRDFDAESDLPLVLVDGYGSGMPMNKNLFVDAAFMTFEPKDGYATLSQPPTLATRAGWHWRGQSSAGYPKTSYRIELWDHMSEDADHAVLGMPEESDWALIASYVDRTLIRNAFVYSLGRDIGMASPGFRFAEVYINNENRAVRAEDYQGVYLLVETIKNAKNRLDLRQLRSTDTQLPEISGGYIFKFDWAASEEPTLECTGSEMLIGSFSGDFGTFSDFSGTCWTNLEVVDPDPLGVEQENWITQYIQDFHDRLHQVPIGNYSELVDIDSFVDLFIINELTRDVDSYTRSAYYYKERDEPIKAGPLWDYDHSLNVGIDISCDVEGWQVTQRVGANDWYYILLEDDAFMAKVAARWLSLRQGLLSAEEINQRIDTLTSPLQQAAERDLALWPVDGIAEVFSQIPPESTWEGQVEAMRNWIHQRMAWLDDQLRRSR